MDAGARRMTISPASFSLALMPTFASVTRVSPTTGDQTECGAAGEQTAAEDQLPEHVHTGERQE